MARSVCYLDHRRDVDLMRYLQRLQRMRGGVVIIKHATLAAKVGCSESTVRRSVDRMVAAGHIIRTHLSRPRGGYLCVYRVDASVIYRRASLMRRARNKIEQLQNDGKQRRDGRNEVSQNPGDRALQNNSSNNKPPRDPSVDRVDKQAMSALLQTARLLGVDDAQRGYLRGAALRYGVYEAWRALEIAVQQGRYAVRDLVRIVWGILKQWHQKEVST